MFKISFITITLNNKEGLLKTIESYKSFNQKYKNTEIIVVDSLSADGSDLLINKYSKLIDKYICEKDNGIYDAMNKGIDNCTGDFICFMNAGDCIIPDKMYDLTKLIDSNSTCYMGDVVWDKKINYFKQLSFCPFLMRVPIHQAMLIPKANCFRFNLEYDIASDLDQKIKIIKLNDFKISKLKIVLSESGGKSQTILSLKEIFIRAVEFYKIAYFHYGYLSGIINNLKFVIWHSYVFYFKK